MTTAGGSHPPRTPERGPIRAGVLGALTGGEASDRVEQEWGTILTGLLDGTRAPLADYRRFIVQQHNPWTARQSETMLGMCVGLTSALQEKPPGKSSAVGPERWLAALPMVLLDCAALMDASLFPLLQRQQRLAWDVLLYPGTYEPDDPKRARWFAGLACMGNAADAIPIAELRQGVLALQEREIDGAAQLAARLGAALIQLDTAIALWESFAHHGHEAFAALPVPPHLREHLGRGRADWVITHAERPRILHLRVEPDQADAEPLDDETLLLIAADDLNDAYSGPYVPGSVAARHLATTGMHAGADGVSPRQYAQLQQRARALLGGRKPAPPRQIATALYERIREQLAL